MLWKLRQEAGDFIKDPKGWWKRQRTARVRSAVNLLGDRDIEWSWIAAEMPPGPGAALDVGNGGSWLGLLAAIRGFEVTAIDLDEIRWPYVHPRLRYRQGDMLTMDLPVNKLDLVINCSVVEHIGLAGRYGVSESNKEGDLLAMARIRTWMRPGARMLLTIPVGRDAVFAPLTRVYGEERLPRLLEGFLIDKESYWSKSEDNRWVLCDRDGATRFDALAGSWDPIENRYALGCFVLRV